jgi:hypothetical protein
MKLIITEDKLYKTFSKFMDKYFDLTYHIIRGTIMGIKMTEYEFIDKDGGIFGKAFENGSFVCSNNKHLMIKSFFGDNTDELLFIYLNDKFGNVVRIKRIS